MDGGIGLLVNWFGKSSPKTCNHPKICILFVCLGVLVRLGMMCPLPFWWVKVNCPLSCLFVKSFCWSLLCWVTSGEGEEGSCLCVMIVG